MTAVARGPETLAVLAKLAAGGVMVGDGVRPDAWATATAGYVVLYPLMVDPDGPAADAYADAESEYQITAVGRTRAQAQFAADKARSVMLAPGLSIPGRALMQPVEWSPSRGVTRDDDEDPPLFYAVDSYLIRTTPAS